MDHGGPYPDGHYNLVIIDKRTRYPVVESSTNFQANKERLKHVFATYGTPRRIETDNGPPFNSKDFREFAEQEGFQHHRVTPLHPRANGEAERFMQTLNKTEQIANLQGKDRLERRNAIHDMLIAYRSTPHPATGITPYEAMRGMTIRTKLDHEEPDAEATDSNEKINQKDAEYKQKMKLKREGSHTKRKRLLLGDYVLVKQQKKNKWSTPYEPVFYTVYDIQGSRITARRTTDGRTVCRDVSHFKLVNSVINTADETETREDGAPIPEVTEDDYREDTPADTKSTSTANQPKQLEPTGAQSKPSDEQMTEEKSETKRKEETVREERNKEQATTPIAISRP
jgi:hypothetical protein